MRLNESQQILNGWNCMTNRLSACALATVIAVGGVSISEAATFYSSLADFLAAAPQSNPYDLPDVGAQGTSATTGPLNFSTFGGSFNIILGTSGVPETFTDGWSSLLTGNDLAISGPENFLLTLVGGAYALGFEIHEPTVNGRSTDNCFAPCFDTEFSVELLRGGSVISSQTILPTDDALTFVGFTDSTAFDAVRITDITSTVDDEFFGNFRIAQSPAPVPLPASLPLLVAGLAGIGWLGKRRSTVG